MSQSDDSAWRKSTFSEAGNCVEVRRVSDGSVEIRDSKAPEGSRLRYSHDEWRAFLAGAIAGEFDDL